MGKTVRERVLGVLQGGEERAAAISVCQYATYELMEKTGAYWPEAHYEAEPMARLAAGGATVIGLGAVRVPYCQTVEAEIFGAKIKDGGRTHIPSIAEHPFRLGDEPRIPADFVKKGRIPAILEAIRILKRKVGDRAVVMGSIVGPFSVAANLVGISALLKASLKKPDSIVPYIEAATETAKQYADAVIGAGAEALVIEDMMASLDMISPRTYRALAAPYETQVISSVGKRVPVIIHICGKLDQVMTDIAATGADAVSVESAVNIPAARQTFEEAGIKTPILGAVHPIRALLEGTPEEVAEAVKKSAAEGAALISPDCAVAPDTPIKNLIAMVEATEKLSK
ncbi:MAG: MtaA/CmuA family methyltransferase [Schwartzia sp.]|nr:MtaA/CmuA family methyltransferase [Schwartzia sp. (in: firmicutes)]